VRKPSNTYHFPPGRNQWESLLSSVSFLKDPIRVITRNMKKYGGTYSAVLTGKGKIIITEDPDFIQFVLRENHSNYQKSVLSTKTAAKLFGNGLLFSNGESWLRQRRLIQPGFHHQKIQGLHEIVAKTAAAYISDFPIGEKIDIYPLMHKLSFAVLIQSLFDINLSSQTIAEISRSFTDLQDFLMKDINQPFRKLFYPLNNADRSILQKSKNIRKILNEIIGQRIASKESHNDLLDMLLSSTYENGEGMEEEQIIDEILVLLFAGHETTANTLSWLLYLLATHPAEAQKLKASIDKTVIYESPQDDYMNAVISEGMRLYPAAWMTERVSLHDDQFGSFRFPRGTIIIPFFYGLHRNKNYWKEESSFNPERFIFSDPVQRNKIKNFFPFGAGPRMCIGNNFAMTEMAFILHIFLSRFVVLPTEVVPVMWPLITLRPRKLILQVKRA
jgi:cytochrome P450